MKRRRRGPTAEELAEDAFKIDLTGMPERKRLAVESKFRMLAASGGLNLLAAFAIINEADGRQDVLDWSEEREGWRKSMLQMEKGCHGERLHLTDNLLILPDT